MTRDILLNNLCPTDTTFDCWNGDEICNCDDCNRVLNKWLDEYDKQIRADVIEEFVKRLKAECSKHYVDCDPYFSGIADSILYEEDIDVIAEELKEQEK